MRERIVCGWSEWSCDLTVVFKLFLSKSVVSGKCDFSLNNFPHGSAADSFILSFDEKRKTKNIVTLKKTENPF